MLICQQGPRPNPDEPVGLRLRSRQRRGGARTRDARILGQGNDPHQRIQGRDCRKQGVSTRRKEAWEGEEEFLT